MPRSRARRWLYVWYGGSSKPVTPARLRKGASLSVLNTSVTFTHCGNCSSFRVANHEGHPIEALLQLVLARVCLVVDQIVVIVLVVTILVHLGHDRELVGMVEIEE